MNTENLVIGKKYQIHGYKHDGKIHRAWDEAIILDIKKDYIVCGNDKTTVTESEGTTWKTKEPAIMYFFKDKWYNVITQLKKDGIYYYCNIATPFIIEADTIKYIDYDLDLRIFATGEYKILDRMEYKYHKKIMHYSDELDIVIQNALKELIQFYKEKPTIFEKINNEIYHKQYIELKKKKKN